METIIFNIFKKFRTKTKSSRQKRKLYHCFLENSLVSVKIYTIHGINLKHGIYPIHGTYP